MFDLKDCYFTIVQLLFIILGIKYSKEISIKEFLIFCNDGFKSFGR